MQTRLKIEAVDGVVYVSLGPTHRASIEPDADVDAALARMVEHMSAAGTAPLSDEQSAEIVAAVAAARDPERRERNGKGWDAEATPVQSRADLTDIMSRAAVRSRGLAMGS